MTFKMSATHRYWWPVQVKQPVADADPKKAGRVETMTLKLLFEAIDQDVAKALDAELAALPKEERESRQHEHIEQVTKDWADVVDDDNQPIPFSLDRFRQAMQRSWFRLAVYKAYAASIAGEEARLKN